MLFRAQVRDTAKTLLAAALQAAGATVVVDEDAAAAGADTGTLEGVAALVSSSVDTPVQGDSELPAVILYVSDSKTGGGPSNPKFRTSVTLTIEVRCDGATKMAAESRLDVLCELIENTLLGVHDFIDLFEAIDSVDSTLDYNGSDGNRHLFSAEITLTAHTSEQFEPTITATLDTVNIYLGTAFDPANPPNVQISTSSE